MVVDIRAPKRNLTCIVQIPNHEMCVRSEFPANLPCLKPQHVIGRLKRYQRWALEKVPIWV